MNIAISGHYIRKTKLDVSWLSYCGDGYVPFLHAMFKPLSNKKKGKITHVSYWNDKPRFIAASTKEQQRQNCNLGRISRLLDRGYYQDFGHPRVKMLFK